MSPFALPVILDNCCISIFFTAGVLQTILTAWPAGTFIIPQRVLDEAAAWKQYGQEVIGICKDLLDSGMIRVVEIDEDSEAEIEAYMKLRLKGPVLGEGESETIAIAYNRGYIAATDDGLARKYCTELFPSVKVVTTAHILNMGLADTLITQGKINDIWRRIRENNA
jgi:predicted nucleic acid-binding protein